MTKKMLVNEEGFNPFTLKDKRILVTGATSGLGKEIALSCAKMGAEIIGAGRDEARVEDVLQQLRTISSLPHRMIRGDLTVQQDRNELIATLDNSINGVAHCAGISRLSPIRMITERHLRQLHAINVEAPMLLTQGILKRNLIASGGSILFIASVAAHIGVAGVGAYSGTKAAVIAMTRCLAMEVFKHRIRANCLSPALVDTPLTAEVVNEIEEERKKYPLGIGRPEDIANAAIYMLSDASRWVTGTTLIMDGGLTVN